MNEKLEKKFEFKKLGEEQITNLIELSQYVIDFPKDEEGFKAYKLYRDELIIGMYNPKDISGYDDLVKEAIEIE